MREQLARIDRSLIETQKLAAGAQKFAAGQNKLSAEASSLRVTRFVTPVAAVVAALGALTAAGPVLMRWLQTHPQCRVQATLSRLERAAARHGGKSA